MTLPSNNDDIPAACNPLCDKMRELGIPNDLNLRAAFQFLCGAVENPALSDEDKARIVATLNMLNTRIGVDPAAFSLAMLKSGRDDPLKNRVKELEQEIERLKAEKVNVIDDQLGSIDKMSGESLAALEKAGKDSISAVNQNSAASAEIRNQLVSQINGAVNEARKEMANRAAQWRREVEQNKTKALKDDLSGLFNRQAFWEYLTKMVPKCIELKTPLCIVLADIDDFHKINDNYGHAVGDAALRLVAEEGIRKIVEKNLGSKNAVCARFGGDEFGVIIPGVDPKTVRRVAELSRMKIRTLKKPLERQTKTYIYNVLTVSIGIAKLDINPEKAGGADKALLQDAMSTVHQARQNGGNQVFFNDT